MGDKTKISWTDSTAMIDRDGRRVRFYQRKDLTRPGQQERRRMAAQGFRWCRRCAAWLPSAQIDKNGLCRTHANEAYREHYAAGGKIAIAALAHARKRNIAPLPKVGADYLMDQFDGKCVYCGAPADSWDHIVPVKHGGETVPWNIAPACLSCNSRKKDTPVEEWLSSVPLSILDLLALEYVA